LGPPIRQQVELVQDPRHVDWPHRLRQHADCAEGARLADVELAFLRGVHHQRDGRGQRVGLDGLHGLEPIHARHQVIHEDDVGSAPLQVLKRLLGRLGRIHGQALLFEHPAQDDSGRS
jgi:hypothetical protein